MAKKSLVVGNKPTSSDVRLAPKLDEDGVAGAPMARTGAVVEVGTVLAAAETVAAGAKSDLDFSSPPPQAAIHRIAAAAITAKIGNGLSRGMSKDLRIITMSLPPIFGTIWASVFLTEFVCRGAPFTPWTVR